MKKSVRKSVKCEVTESGLKCIRIYEVHAVKKNGERDVYARFLNKKEAEESKEVVDECFKKRYTCSYIMEELVWC